MATDELKEENQETLTDKLLGVGEAVLGTVAGAALFYRSGGAKYLSGGLERTSRFLSHAHTEISARSLEDWNTNEIKDVTRGLRRTWNSIGDDVRERSIDIRTDDQRSIFNILGEITRLDRNPGEYVSEMYNREKLINPTLAHFQENLSNGNKAFENKMFSFLDGLATKINDDISVYDHIDISHFTDEEKLIADQVVTHMKGLDTPSERHSFKEANERIVRQVADLAENLDNLEEVYGTTGSDSRRDKILGDKAATIGDLLANRQKIRESRNYYKDGKELRYEDTIASLDRLREKYKGMGDEFEQRFLNLTPDAGVLRKDENGNIHSFKAASKIVDGALDFLAGTLPGKILKLRDVQYGQKAPALQFIGKGETDPILAALTNRAEGSQTNDHFFRVLNKVYRTTDSGLEHVKEADNLTLISGNYGSQSKLLRQMMGHVDYKRANSIVARAFDINQDGEDTYLKKGLSVVRKYSDDTWYGNIAKRLLSPTNEDRSNYAMNLLVGDRNYAVDYLSKMRKFNTFLSKNNYELSPEAIKKMLSHTTGEAHDILERLSLNDEELVNSLLAREGSSLRHEGSRLNPDLDSLIHDFVANPKKSLDAITLKTDRTGFEPGGYGGGHETANFHDILRMELGKEMFLQHAKANEQRYGENGLHQAIVDLVNQSGLTGKEKTEAKRLGHWAAFQNITGISARADYTQSHDTNRMWKTIADTEELFNNGEESESRNEFRSTIVNMVKDKLSMTDGYASRNTEIAGRRKYNSWIHMQKAVTPIDLVKSINDSTKFKATGKKFVKQFFAGRKDPRNITAATMYPYFFLARLSDEMNGFGIGLSRESMGSVGQMAKNIALKRILPVGIGLTYFDWMDDTTQELTGTSMTGAFANGLANTDLAYRRISDATGITDVLKDEKAMNPILQYWFGKDPYQDYDERKDYYENGYDPVRKGRYWTFGGVNEFRGGQIAYWEPNFVRRINSDYQDKSLYDGYWDKWSHSWLPTPTNPVSPVMALLDPYWLENKHKEDRPYPVSGTLFSEGTPWGAVLNPTVGEAIKPQRKLNTNRLEDGVDVKALIFQMNKEVQAKALNNSNQNLVVLKGGTMEPVEFTAYNAPTRDERVYSMNYEGNRLAGSTAADYGVYSGGVTPEEYMRNSGNGGMPMELQGAAEPTNADELSIKEQFELDAATGNSLSQLAGGFVKHINPTDGIRNINRAIAMKAQMQPALGVMTPEKIVNLRASYGASLLNDAETVDELMSLSTGNDMIKESALSIKLISGIYGYGANKLVGLGDNTQKRIATSADMDNPFRAFWDSGFGGAGGGVMEIARRFMPEFKRNTRVNPLMNTMQDWLPERFRFGDPFTAVPKGEMRMPGEGYESLNELHPDQFGDYGAFDRFKVLADIAPYSAEYKVWKKIAQKTVMDPELKEEMKKIKSRVSQQNNPHDFYNYQFVGRGVDYQNVTVTQVLDRGKFKIYGSDEVYKLAGLKLKATKDGKGTQEILAQHLHAGQEVTIAVDENEHYQKNTDKDRSISAAVYIDGENLSRQLVESGIGEVRKGDTSAAASIGRYTGFQQFRGYVAETIAHLDLPLINDQWLRVRSPLESYKAEQVYGTPYQTWADPIGTFLLPAMERAISDNVAVTVGEIAAYSQRISQNIEGLGRTKRKMITGALMLANRGAFIGGTLGYLIKPDSGKMMRAGARIGSAAMTIGHLYNGLNDPLESALGFGHLAYEIAEVTKTPRVKSIMVGMAAGLALYGANTNVFSENAGKEWIPDRTKKKWEMQEYFDRLNYIKYMGLYSKAASKALDEEDIDVEKLVRKQEIDAEKKEKLKEELTNAKSKIALLPQGDTRRHLEEMINKKLASAQESQVILRAGRWTQAALLYKEAAESTSYGIKEGGTYAQIIRALPKNEREYFLEFVKERDPDERAKILKTASPLLARALKRTWGEEQDDMESNESYFMNHNLPSFSWSGWRPDVDLKDVQVKTIANEGMLLGDFGLYDSELRNPDVINAPNLNPRGGQDPLTLQANLLATLKGLGLTGVDVSVQPAPMGSIEVIANVASIVENKVESTVNDIFRLL